MGFLFFSLIFCTGLTLHLFLSVGLYLFQAHLRVMGASEEFSFLFCALHVTGSSFALVSFVFCTFVRDYEQTVFECSFLG